jgi:hypothetical protein
MKTTLTFLFLLGQSISIALAQAPTSQPLKLGDINVSGSLRTRVESWDWFQDISRVHRPSEPLAIQQGP